MRRTLLAITILLAALPGAVAQQGGTDMTIALAPGEAPRIEGIDAIVRVSNATPGERYELDLVLTKEYTTFEVRAHGFEIERPAQLVPSLVLPESEYPLFHQYVNERIWEAEAPTQLFWVGGTASDVVLRLGITGPRNVTLVLERDVTPPTFQLGNVTNVTHIGFYQETTTGELAYGDLQIRTVGASEWVVNPTPELHVRQRFPVQGLQPSTEHEARVVFTDWAGNNVTSDTFRVTTSAAPVLPTPLLTPVSPAPNALLNVSVVTIRARIESPDSPLVASTLTFFFDKRTVSSGVEYRDGEIVYTPAPLAPGKHSVGIEVLNEAGAKGETHWSFTVQDEQAREAPGIAFLGTILVIAIALALRRRI